MKFCTGCGQKIPDNSVQCPSCGKLTNPLSNSKAKAGVKPPVKKAAVKKQAAPSASTADKDASALQPKMAPKVQSLKSAKKAPVQKSAVKKQAAKFDPPTPGNTEPNDDTAPSETVFMPMDPDSGMDTGRAFAAITRDSDWLRKCLIVGLSFLVPILNLFALGFFVQYARNVSGGIDIPMPEIEFESQWKSGALYFLSLSSLAMLGSVVFIILIYFAQLPIIMIFAYLFLIAFAFFYLLYFTVAATLSIIQGNPWLVYDFQEVIEIITDDITPILISALILFGLSLLFPFIITTGYAYLVSAHVTGQLGRVIRSSSKF